MDTSEAPSDLESRKKVRVRLRPNLILSRQCQAGQTCYVVKDPVSLSYFRLDDRQRFLVGLMDGTHTLEDIRKAYQRQYRPQRLSLEELEYFTSLLLNSGLAQSESPHAGARLFERSEKQRRALRANAFLNFLNIKIPLFDPDRLLGALLPSLRFVFAPAFLALALGLVLSAVGLLVTHWGEFLARLPALHELFRLRNVLCLWLILGVVKILHEFGHGLCCKALGGEVHEMGLQFLFLFPALYCDVSDSWMLPRKSRRIAISLAGIYVELLLASAATFLWWATDPATVLNTVCLGLMIICGVNTVVLNANPLMRFDGYYALSDWLEVPNLSAQATRVVQAAVMRWLGIEVPAEGPAIATRKGLLASYAVASYVYRWMVLVGTFWMLYTFLEPRKLAAVWFTLMLASLAVLLGWPVYRFVRAIHQQGRFPDMKPVRLWLSGAGLAAIVAMVCFVPFPVNVQGVALLQVEPDQVQRVAVAELGGFLKELLVRDGQQIHAGDVLAVLTNPDLEIKLQVNEADQALRLQQKNALLAQPADSIAAESQVAEGLQQAEFDLTALVQEHATLREQRARLVLRAPRGGTVLGLCSPEDKGKWLDRGTEFCRIGNVQTLRAVLLVPPGDHELVGPGKRAWVRVHGGGGERWPGVVTEIAQVEAKSIPAPLSSRAGGEVATQQDPLSKTDQPCQQHYLCAVRLQVVDPVLQAGAMGRVRVDAGSQTLWGRFRRYMATTFGLNA